MTAVDQKMLRFLRSKSNFWPRPEKNISASYFYGGGSLLNRMERSRTVSYETWRQKILFSSQIDFMQTPLQGDISCVFRPKQNSQNLSEPGGAPGE